MPKIGDQIKTKQDIAATDYITIPAGSIGVIREFRPGAVRVLFQPQHTIGLQWCPVSQVAEQSSSDEDDAAAEALYATITTK